jgi:hypothetical protein
MANANGWGDGASNNNIGWGKGADNAIGWGDIHADSYAGLTDIVGTASFSNTKSILLDGIDDSLGTFQSNQWVRGKTGTISDINDGNWHHACLTYDGSQLLSGFTLYYDNSSLAILPEGTQGTPTNVSTVGLADFMIGARGTAASIGIPFNGNLDEVSYFTSELSSGDVSTIYNSGIPNDISSLNPVGWWRCGDGDTSHRH